MGVFSSSSSSSSSFSSFSSFSSSLSTSFTFSCLLLSSLFCVMGGKFVNNNVSKRFSNASSTNLDEIKVFSGSLSTQHNTLIASFISSICLLLPFLASSFSSFVSSFVSSFGFLGVFNNISNVDNFNVFFLLSFFLINISYHH